MKIDRGQSYCSPSVTSQISRSYRAPFFRQNCLNSPQGCYIDTVYLDCLPIIHSPTHTHKPTRIPTHTYTHVQHFNTDTRFLRPRSRSAATLYISAETIALTRSRRPTRSCQHVHISAFSFFLETCLPHSTIAIIIFTGCV